MMLFPWSAGATLGLAAGAVMSQHGPAPPESVVVAVVATLGCNSALALWVWVFSPQVKETKTQGRPSLRDLSEAIYALAREHPCYSQASAVVQNCCDHLCAIARVHEVNRGE